MNETWETEIASQVVFLLFFFSFFPFPIFIPLLFFFLNPSSSSPELLRLADYRPIRGYRQPAINVDWSHVQRGFFRWIRTFVFFRRTVFFVLLSPIRNTCLVLPITLRHWLIDWVLFFNHIDPWCSRLMSVRVDLWWERVDVTAVCLLGGDCFFPSPCLFLGNDFYSFS